MTEPESVNRQIVNAIQQLNQATPSPPATGTGGSGKAYQSVSQSAAIAVQDAVDNLRNVSTISTTAIGVAMAQYLVSGELKYKHAIKEAQDLVTQASSAFEHVGKAAAKVLTAFPNG